MILGPLRHFQFALFGGLPSSYGRRLIVNFLVVALFGMGTFVGCRKTATRTKSTASGPSYLRFKLTMLAKMDGGSH